MNDQDRQSHMPTVLVVLLALLGFSILPQGQGGRGGGPAGNLPRVPARLRGVAVTSPRPRTKSSAKTKALWGC